MSRLVIKFPTRNRPERFMNTFTKYVEYLSGKHDVFFIVTMDEDDETMNTPEIRKFFEQFDVPIEYHYGHSKTKIEAVNANMEHADGDVLLLASDDMVPQVKNYDDIIFGVFAHSFPDFDGAVKFWDGLRAKTDSLMTLCVMGFPLYRKFGYIYYPGYKSVYADNEQTVACGRMGKLAISPDCIVKHIWRPEYDELHSRNESKEMYAHDRMIFHEREKHNFDIESM